MGDKPNYFKFMYCSQVANNKFSAHQYRQFIQLQVMSQPPSRFENSEFVEISDIYPGPGCVLEDFNAYLRGCSCTNGCLSADSCACQSHGQNYDEFGRLIFGFEDDRPLIECGEDCGCGPSCSNRVIQRGEMDGLTVVRVGLRNLKNFWKNFLFAKFTDIE